MFFKFSPPKIRGKDEAVLTTSIFLKGVGLVQPPTCLGSREEMFTFYFWKGVFKKGVDVLWGSSGSFVFLEETYSHLEFIFWGWLPVPIPKKKM